MSRGFVPPAYPYDRLNGLRAVADKLPGGVVDCSAGSPCDPPPEVALQALSASGAERGYPPSIGSPAYRQAAVDWLQRRFGVTVDAESQVGACVGSKEFVVSLPHYLKLRRPDLDTVLYPSVSYPSYAMGAVLAGCRAVGVPVDQHFRIDLDAVRPEDARRALCLWVNTPGNPAGGLDDLEAAAAWGRAQGVLVVSDECYAEFTWEGPPRTVLTSGSHHVLAVHSLSKRSNLAGVRAGFFAGDSEYVRYLQETRKHAGAMVPGPVQAAAAAAWSEDDHVDKQRHIYRRRLDALAEIAAVTGVEAAMPEGAFYLWVSAPDGDAWAYAELLATRGGLIVSPGEFYCDTVNAADDAIDLAANADLVQNAALAANADLSQNAALGANADLAANADQAQKAEQVSKSGAVGPNDPRGYVRMAAVVPDDRLSLVLDRLTGN